MAAPAPERRRFTFTVDNKGSFLYDPSDPWDYNRHDTLEFRSPNGPFTIDFKEMVPSGIARFNPLGGPLIASKDDDGTWVAETTVIDNLSDAKRDAIWNANRPADGSSPGFVVKYNYQIDATQPDGKRVHEEQHHGVFGC